MNSNDTSNAALLKFPKKDEKITAGITNPSYTPELNHSIYFDILDSVQVNIAVLDNKGNIIFVNKAWENFSLLNGQPASYNYLNKNYLEICKKVIGDEKDYALTAHRGIKSIIEGNKDKFELEYACHSPRHERWFIMKANAIKSGKGSVAISHIDITAQKRKETVSSSEEIPIPINSLDKSNIQSSRHGNNNFTNNIIEGMEEAVYVKNLKGEYVFINKAGAALLEKRVSQILNTTCEEHFTKKECKEIKKADEQVMDTNRTTETEKILKINGKKHSFTTTKGPLYDKDGEVIGIFGISADISDRKKSEKVLKDSAEDNKSYIREIHHRVKNSLQMVSDLIEHEMHEISDESALDILKNSQDRIFSIAQLHRNLYQQENQEKVNLSDYIKNLGLNLSESFVGEDNRIDIIFNLDKLEVSAEKAQYLGLIITELLTNAFRHAFPKQDKEIIKLTMKKKDEEYAYITIYDNGIGIIDKKDNKQTASIGLDLVEIFTKQIGGSIQTVKTKKGTKFKLLFKL
ncbi:MAG: PAS domain-containing protein [Deltaproteobacteria bacterium]